MTEPLQFSLPVTVDNVNMLKDRSVTCKVSTTQEISDQEFNLIHRAFQKEGWFLFSENRIDEADIPKDDAPSDLKTPSERLRAALYVLYRQETKGQDAPETFDEFYKRRMNKLIDFITAKLEPR
jgi:hypothetical protein